MNNIAVVRDFTFPVQADFYIRDHKTQPNEESAHFHFDALKKYASSVDYDLAYISTGLFAVEKAYRQEGINGKQLDGTITFLVDNLDLWNTPDVKEILSNIVGLSLHHHPKIDFQPISRVNKYNNPEHIDSGIKSICLFSGGIDSLSGILNTKKYLGPTKGLFVSHSKSANIVNNIEKDFLIKDGIELMKVRTQMSSASLQQLRGLLYLSFGAITAKMHNIDDIVVSETGPIMYQPKLTALDEVTITTHPFLIKMVKELLKLIYGNQFSFYEPFENLTKSEVVACCPDQEALKYTHSCRITRFIGSKQPHCGSCYGCLVRRTACLVAGVDDSNFGGDVLLKGLGEERIGWRGTITDSTMNDLRALLQFSRQILTDGLPESSALKIRQFKKEELLRRFALDVFSALYLLYDKEKIGHNEYCAKFYEDSINHGIVIREQLSNRIQEVRNQKYKPNFSMKI